MPQHDPKDPKRQQPDSLVQAMIAEAQLRPFIRDTLAPWIGGAGYPAGGVHYFPYGSLGQSGTATGETIIPSGFESLFGAKERINLTFDNYDSMRKALIHEYTHLSSDTRDPAMRNLEVPRGMWETLMTPQERAETIEEYKYYPGSGTWLDEDFAFRAENVMDMLIDIREFPTKSVQRTLDTAALTRRDRYLMARLLNRQNTPFYNHPHKEFINRWLREKAAEVQNTERPEGGWESAAQKTRAEQRRAGQTFRQHGRRGDAATNKKLQQLNQSVKHFIFAGTQINSPTGGNQRISRRQREQRYGAAYKRMWTMINELAEIVGKSQAQRVYQETKARWRAFYGLEGD